jgi:hypothetical protein
MDSVKASLYIDDNNNNTTYLTLASAAYINGGFTLTLPATVSNQYLTPFMEETPDGIYCSDVNVKTSNSLQVNAYKNGATVYRGFLYDDGNHDYRYDGVRADFLYADRDADITGTVSEGNVTLSCSVHFKRGWNIMYEVVTNSGNNVRYTTSLQSGLGWYFDEN